MTVDTTRAKKALEWGADAALYIADDTAQWLFDLGHAEAGAAVAELGTRLEEIIRDATHETLDRGLVHTIGVEDLGSYYLTVRGRPLRDNPLGYTQERDIGKRVYERDGDGVLQVENDAQFQKRTGKVWRRYVGTVTVDSDVPVEEWDSDDKDDMPLTPFSWNHEVGAFSADEAVRSVLDKFHEAFAIACLDNFDIQCHVEEG